MSTTTATPKKPPTPAQANARRPSANPSATTTPTNSATPNRSNSAMAPQSSVATGNAATGVKRTRSIRNGPPVSARAAVRKPAQESDTAVEDIKADMQAKLDELNDRLQQAEAAYESSHKQAAFLQVKLEEAMKDQGALEEQVHESTERIEELENEKKESLRARRELEHIYEAERVASMKEKEVVQAREDEMQSSMQRMKEALAQREMRAGLDDEHRRPSVSRASSFRSIATSPNPDGAAGQFAPPSSLQRSDSRSSSKLVMQKDKIIEGLRLELAEAQIKLVEVDNMGGSRMHELQKQMMEIKVQNARLMEENESFQLLLSEKTLNGDLFAAGQAGDLRPTPSNAGSRPPSSRVPNAGVSLADELDSGSQADNSSFIEGSSSANDESSKRLQSEVNSLKDQNKALTLYINNIISRLLQHESFEQILDKTPDIMAGPTAASRRYGPADAEKDLPPPPPPKDDTLAEKEAEQQQPTGFLQRAKSVMGGSRPKRPTSMAVPQADQQALQSQLKPAVPEDHPSRANETPETAPAIPLSRSRSTRGSSAHRRANSEWPAASLVTNMYRGPSPGLQGPVSPGLTSPASNRSSFFGPAIGLGPRMPSGSTVPTISEAETNKENLPQQRNDTSKPPSTEPNHRTSIISTTHLDVLNNPTAGDQGGSGGDSTRPSSGDFSNPSSPPRSTTSSGGGERDNSRQAPAIMMGSKMRPLRLVQDAVAAQDEVAKKAANRGSWFGWMNKGGSPPVAMGRSVSGGEGAA